MIRVLIIIMVLAGMNLSAQPKLDPRPISEAGKSRIMAMFHRIKSELIPSKPHSFLLHNDYSVASIERARIEIAKANLKPVREYMLRALADNNVKSNKDLNIIARSVWVDYLLNVDSIHMAYEEATRLAAFADSVQSDKRYYAYMALAFAAFQTNDYATTNEYQSKAVMMVSETNNNWANGRLSNLAGSTARKYFYGSSGQAFPHYFKAIEHAEKAGDTATQIRSLLLVYLDTLGMGHAEAGIPFIEEAISLAIKSRYLKFGPGLCEALHRSLEILEKKEECLFMLKSALNYIQEFGMPYMETHMFIQLGYHYLMTDPQYDSALFYMNQCRNKGLTVPGFRPPDLEKALVYKRMGKYQEAATFYEAGIGEYLNSFIMEGQNSISKWETRLRIHEKELQLKETRESGRRLVWIIIAISVVFLSAVWAYFRQRALKLRMAHLNKTIIRQRDLLTESLAERELLLKEIHHRVKNNLQVISGLLQLQQEEIADEKSNAAFNEGKSRVSSIALIHQNLYQHENLGSIQFEPFVKDLTNQVKEVFESSGCKIKVNIKIPEMLVDIDSAVPLGLILNELLTNSYKYGCNSEHPEIYICLEDAGDGCYRLGYRDNGPGIKSGVDFNSAKTLGLRLIKGLANQLSGNADYHFDKGSVFTILFKDAAARRRE